MSSAPIAATKSRRLLSSHIAASPLSTVIRNELTSYLSSSPCAGYLDPSDPTMISAADRKMVVDWCFGIVDHFQLSRESVAMAMEMVDRFLDMPSCTSDAARVADGSLRSQGTFQLLAIAALYCSIKAKEKHVTVSSNLFAKMCGGLYTKGEIEGMESILLRSGLILRCHDAPTAYQVGHSILSLLAPHVNIPESTWAFLLDEMKYQTEHAVRDYYFSTQRTSTIALAAIWNALEGIGSPKKRQEVMGALIVRIMDCFDFDHSNVISAGRKRLQRLIQGDVIVHEQVSSFLDNPMKAFSIDGEHADWDDFMKTFDSDCETMTMPVHSQPAPATKSRPRAAAVSVSRDIVFTKTMNNNSTDNMVFKSCETTPNSILTVSPDNIPAKPQRPLTAYFIYLQIEKEFIIQSMAGEDADKSIYDNKVYLDYVPERYRKTKLSPDWYFGPGKKKKSEKRKHRKQRGKIGFVELSQMVSARWAKLEETDPDIKSFIQKLANQELNEYRRDLKEYNKLIKKMAPTLTPRKSENTKRALEGHFKYEEGASQKSSRSESSNSFLLEPHKEGEEQQKDIDHSFLSLSLDLNGFQYLPFKQISSNELSHDHDEALVLPRRRLIVDDKIDVEREVDVDTV